MKKIDIPAPIELLVNSDLMLKIDGEDRQDMIMLGEFIPKGPFVMIGPGNGKPLNFDYERNPALPRRVRVYSMGMGYDGDKQSPIIRANVECILPSDKYLMNFMLYQQSGSLPEKDFIAYTSVSAGDLAAKREEIIRLARSDDHAYIVYLADLVSMLEKRD